MEQRFKVQLSEDTLRFLRSLDEKAKTKILFNITRAQQSNDRELFKKLTEDVWEFRTLFNNTHYRIFAFWDKTGAIDTIVFTTHGIIKKTGKTPKKELDKAEKIRKNYFEHKRQQ